MKAQIISFHCVLMDVLGQVINTSFNRDVITQLPGSASTEVTGLPARLKEVKPGERRKITLKADEAYGLYDPALTMEVSRQSLTTAEALAVGDRVHLPNPHGGFRLYRITKIIGHSVYLDANHPLAGQDLVFDVHIVDARDATEEEILESSAPDMPRYLQ